MIPLSNWTNHKLIQVVNRKVQLKWVNDNIKYNQLKTARAVWNKSVLVQIDKFSYIVGECYYCQNNLARDDIFF